MNSTPKSIPELLAPAGSIESFNAAIEAGADAIYLGVGELNARLRARNFTMKSLSYLVAQAREEKVKIYVTLNTLVKQEELKAVLDLLYQLKQIQVDAIIVQDLGLAYLARKHFPELTLHASTQMAIHNSVGLQAAQQIGIKRAVLSRELTLDEIQQLQKTSEIELEVFIHGALCYSISGLCLASSYLGGWSGNRGRCTQVCRRKFSSQQQAGHFFSPKDLWAIDYLAKFAETGICSLKIEGRMKSAEYVYSVVSAYRKLLDGKATPEQIKSDLSLDLGREKTSFYLGGKNNGKIIVTDRPSGTGINIGQIISVSKRVLEIETDQKIKPGDRLRVQNFEGDEGVPLVVKDISNKQTKVFITAKEEIIAKKGDSLFLISSKQNKKSQWGQTRQGITPVRFHKQYPKTQKALQAIRPKNDPELKSEAVFTKIDNPDWFNILKSYSFDYVILSGGQSMHDQAVQLKKQLNFWKNRLIIQFPPFIPESELNTYQALVAGYQEAGIFNWMSSHFSQHLLFPKGDHIFADTSVWTTNLASQKILFDQGYKGFSYSIEDDILNLKATGNNSGIMPLFGYIPLFISRVPPATRDQGILDDKGQGFMLQQVEDLTYTNGELPFCLFHRREKLKQFGIHRFLIDFSWFHPSRKLFKTIMYDFQEQNKMQGTTLFNHKSGLK